MFVSSRPKMRRRYNGPDAVAMGDPAHLDRFVHGFRAVVDTGSMWQ